MPYYRLIPVHIGETVRILPNGYYERMDAEGNYDDSNLSEHLESCFGADVYRCVYGLGNWLRKSEYFVYMTDVEPCLNLNKTSNPLDYQLSGEVRYRKPVEARLIGKLTVSTEAREHCQKIGRSIQNKKEQSLVQLLEEICELKNMVQMETISTLQEEIPIPMRSEWAVGELLYCDCGSFVEQCVVAEVYSMETGDALLLWGNEGYIWMDATDSRLMSEANNKSVYRLNEAYCPIGLLPKDTSTRTVSS